MGDEEKEEEKIASILWRNRKKNFVQRIIYPEKYPTLDLGKGVKASHLMAWAEAKGKFVVYPTVQYDSKTKKLTQRKGKDAFLNAMRKGDYIDFDTPEEADWFSKSYKKVWRKSGR